MNDRPVKRERVHALLDERGADELVLTSAAALSWYLDGARIHVSLAADPVLAVLVTRDADRVFTVESEAARLIAEELPADVELTAGLWESGIVIPSARGIRISEADVASELRAARASLLPVELDRYRQLCAESAEALTDAIRDVAPGSSERALAARVIAELAARAIDPLVVLVAGRDRLAHRHPLPTDSPLGDRFMVVVCGRRHGLIANATRWARFGAEQPDEVDATARILRVERAYLDATRPGELLSDVLAAGTAAYAGAGFAADEWRRHHQGGAAGYAGRDPRAAPGLPDVVHERQAFAWNPSAPGVKVEDTVLVESAGVTPLTVDPRWPTVTVDGLARPAELRLD